ncbi:hypothetical protein V6N13_038880 [Hibiscus sabdariffa]
MQFQGDEEEVVWEMALLKEAELLRTPHGNNILLPDGTPMEGLLEPPKASLEPWQMKQLVHVSSTPVLESEGSPFPVDEVRDPKRMCNLGDVRQSALEQCATIS